MLYGTKQGKKRRTKCETSLCILKPFHWNCCIVYISKCKTCMHNSLCSYGLCAFATEVGFNLPRKLDRHHRFCEVALKQVPPPWAALCVSTHCSEDEGCHAHVTLKEKRSWLALSNILLENNNGVQQLRAHGQHVQLIPESHYAEISSTVH